MKGISIIIIQLLAVYQLLSQIIPSDRRIDWNPGIPTGIPSYTIFADVTNVPYNAVNDGITDASPAIQSAIDACPNGQAIYIPEGTYNLAIALKIREKSIVIRGAGPNKTKLKGSIDIHSYSTTDTTGIISGFSKNSTVITVNNSSKFQVGNYILLDQLNDPEFVTKTGYYPTGCSWCSRENGNRGMGQINRIIAKSNNILTLEHPLYLPFLSDLHPQILKVSSQPTTMTGIEDLYIEHTTSNYNISIRLSANCWVKNVESYNGNKGHVQLSRAYGCEIRDSYFHHGVVYTSGSAYGIMTMDQSTDNLIENNIFYYLRHSMVLEGGGTGNVFGYNYSSRVFDDNYPNTDWLCGDMITHGTHPYMNLFEGNIAVQVSLDNTWGSSSHNTFFRNHIVRQSKGENKEVIYSLVAIDLEENNRYENVIGNILGTEGCGGTVEVLPYTSASLKVIWKLGYHYPAATGMPTDTLVKKTLLQHGNFDYISNSVSWDQAISDHTLPQSYYLSSKPAFYGELAWPSIGPDINGYVGILPAKKRFDDLSIGFKNIKRNNSFGLTIFPNPIKNTININFEVNRISKIIINLITIDGKYIKNIENKIFTKGNHSVSYNIENFTSGIYFISISNHNNLIIKKLIKI